MSDENGAHALLPAGPWCPSCGLIWMGEGPPPEICPDCFLEGQWQTGGRPVVWPPPTGKGHRLPPAGDTHELEGAVSPWWVSWPLLHHLDGCFGRLVMGSISVECVHCQNRTPIGIGAIMRDAMNEIDPDTAYLGGYKESMHYWAPRILGAGFVLGFSFAVLLLKATGW